MKPPSKKMSRKKWTNDDELELLQIWESHQNELRQAKRNAHIYSRMSEEMGGKFTPNEVHIKIKNLMQRYRSEKKDLGPSVGSLSKWAHFNCVHKIIGSNAANNNAPVESFSFFATNTNSNEFPSQLMFSPTSPSPPSSPLSPLLNPEVEQSSSESSISFEPSTSNSAKRKRRSHQAEIIDSFYELKKQGEKKFQVSENVATVAQGLLQNLANYMQSKQKRNKIFMEYLKKLVEKKQAEKQLKIFENVTTAIQGLSQNLANYMQSQQENDKIFMEYLKKLVEKED